MRQERNRSGYVANKDRKNLKAAWSWGHKFLGMPHISPFDGVPKRAEVRQVRYVPPIEDFWKVYNGLNFEQDKRLLLTFLHTAVRRDEIFRLKWKDVDFENRTIRLWSRKNRIGEWQSHKLLLTDDLHDALLEQKRVTEDYEHVFIDPQSENSYAYRKAFMKKACTRAADTPFGFHSIRHLAASYLAELNVPTIDIQQILRHSNISTTDRYIRSLQEGAAGAVSKLPSIKNFTRKDTHRNEKRI